MKLLRYQDCFTKFLKAPGSCSLEEVGTVRTFLDDYIYLRDIYRSCSGDDCPIGYTLESILDKVLWYVNHLQEGK
jgi:hypothetical protein